MYFAFDSAVPALKVSPRHRVEQELTEGESGTITCQFEGNVISYRWVLPNRKPLPSRMHATENVLAISSVLKEDSGIYSCVAEGVSDVVEALINVTIQRKYT